MDNSREILKTLELVEAELDIKCDDRRTAVDGRRLQKSAGLPILRGISSANRIASKGNP
jgi:hypothetical protein